MPSTISYKLLLVPFVYEISLGFYFSLRALCYFLIWFSHLISFYFTHLEYNLLKGSGYVYSSTKHTVHWLSLVLH